MLNLDIPPKLVIFDCDGVLVNSEPIFNRVLHEFLQSCGAKLSFSKCCNLFTGKSRHDVEHYLTGEGLRIPKDWSVGFYEQALDALKNEVTAVNGVRDVLRKLINAEVPFCVASNGLMAKMEVTLERTKMLPWFEGKMFSAYDVGLSKPAPDVFLHAAKVHDVRPDECVVVEDSASGFEAAANAEMTCLAYLSNEVDPKDNLFGAHKFHEMKVLPTMLGLA
ncbi:MAG: HAD-IA family hydrolase [Sulfitobacter sp.]